MKSNLLQNKDGINISGFGVILKNGWPNSYGTYKSGLL
jgi:hypothetical protein